MSQFIIATHSYLADGYKNSIEFFDNSVSNVHYINSYIDDQKNFVDQLKEILDHLRTDQVIVLTDIPGGSVNKEAASLIKEYGCKVISGINLPLVLELVLSTDSSLTEEKISSAVNQARSQLVYMNDLIEEDIE